MHSIRAKITLTTMAAILVCVLAIGSGSILSIKAEGDRNSTEMMRLLCQTSCDSIDKYLDSIEQSVDLVSRYAMADFDTLELVKAGLIGSDEAGGMSEGRRAALDAYLAGHLHAVESLFSSVAGSTHGALAFYYRLSPEISEEQAGFLYTNIHSPVMTKVPLTDLSAYEPDDVEHVGWYYIPQANGVPTWIDPYYNANLGIRMFSYVTPLYCGDVFLGVIGMDISYETLVSQIRNIRVFDTGYACLVTRDGSIIYHPQLESGTRFAEVGSQLAATVGEMEEEEHNTEPIFYTRKRQERQMFFGTLSNGLKLLVTAPVSEINAPWLRLMNRIGLVAFVIILVLTAFITYWMQRITEPLKRLTEASKDLAQGRYDVKLDYNGMDEVGILTASFRQLVEHLKVYIGDLNSKAYRDAMTGVRNKGAYTLAERKLDDEIRFAAEQGETPGFAMVMMDCNDLKTVNDTYGHDKGDIYLRKACGVVCTAFPHSPVFRTGGDEFVVLLQGEAYEQRRELMKGFYADVDKANARAGEPWEFVHIAVGVAAFDPATDQSAESVLRRADELMYENKKMLKAGRANARSSEASGGRA